MNDGKEIKDQQELEMLIEKHESNLADIQEESDSVTKLANKLAQDVDTEHARIKLQKLMD